MKLPIEANVIPVLSVCLPFFTFQKQQRELRASSLVSLNKFFNLVIE